MNETPVKLVWRAETIPLGHTSLNEIHFKLKRYIHANKLNKFIEGPKIVEDGGGREHIKVKCTKSACALLCNVPGILSFSVDCDDKYTL